MTKNADHIEATVARLWRELLNVPAVAPEDNFLDQGGNSLRAGELAARLYSEFGVDVSIDVVLNGDSLASFSRDVGRMVNEASGNKAALGES